MTQPATLSYAPPKRRRWRWWKVLLVLVVLSSAIYYPPRVYRWAKDRAKLMSIQNTCRNFTAPAMVPAYAEGETVNKVPPSLQHFGIYSDLSSYRANTNLSNIYRGRVVALDQLLAYVPPGSNRFFANLFLHERTSRGGESAIIVVNFISNRFWTASLFADVFVITPAGVFSPKSPISRATTVPLGAWPSGGGELNFFIGQPDPADAARFTIGYDHGGQSGVIDGVLNDDLTVTLTARTSPLVKSPTTQEAR